MKIEQVNKTAYRKHLNIVIGVFVTVFAVLSLVFGALLITFFGAEPQAIINSDVINNTTEPVSNFKYNLAGVILALIFCGMLINQFKHHAFMKDVYYVWRLKQLHNQIYRRLAKIKIAAKANNENAFIILSFYYLTLKLVYELDNNTLTLSALERDTALLEESIAKVSNKSIQEFALLFDQSMLKQETN